ncbi:hypothetical protein FS827_01785 [Agrobacterium vitis]|uniref:hypothetical protein n=1 Tax=Rhizobium/Agrobacterium group TaxID=227290 RepID=UPI0012E878C5|nr:MULTISPECIES: hypothetical protein [Rhizobium/Agrobacterium group]MCF1460042.1 hypothetical protein [Allorhizobium ampelinum]MVA70807.1 hypothetical protein [Agrobacterium vitis]
MSLQFSTNGQQGAVTNFTAALRRRVDAAASRAAANRQSTAEEPKGEKIGEMSDDHAQSGQ